MRRPGWRQRASAEAFDEPAKSPDLVNSYRQSAELLRVALASADAPQFAAEAGRALMRRGFALYYAGDLEEASQAFQKSHEAGVTVEQKRDALWYAIVALDRAVDGGKVSLAKERDRLAVLYLQQYPDTEDAAKLLLRQAQAELLGDEATLKILMAVTPDQPLYEAARRQAARVLYRVYRKAPATDKGFAAVRFADVAEEILRIETGRAASASGEEGTRAAQNVLLLVRQLSDALLAGTSPDVKRVESALQLLEGVASMHRLDLSALDAELAFRRLQIAIASRINISRAVGAALAEVGSASACLVLVENPAADLTGAALARVAERHGHLAAIRDTLLSREDLPTETRQALVATLADTLARFVTHREWLPEAQKPSRAKHATAQRLRLLPARRRSRWLRLFATWRRPNN